MLELHARLAEAKSATGETAWSSEDDPGRVWVMTSEFEAALPDVSPSVVTDVLRDMYRRGVLYGCPCGCRGDWHTTSWTFSDAQKDAEGARGGPARGIA